MSDPLRVLFVSNSGTTHCGVAEYGRIWAAALRKAGVDVHELDASYPAIYARKYYLPENAHHYDLIHLNWDPAATNHFLPEHFPQDVPLSLFLHDVPPNSTCPLWDRAVLRMAFEPAEGIHQVIDHAVPDIAPSQQVFLRERERDPSKVVIGTAGLRADPGHAMVEEVCDRHGWVYNGPWKNRWLSTEEEISRLALSTVNVCWYRTSGRGKSMAAMFCCAARRPLLLSGSSMFSVLRPYTVRVGDQPSEIYCVRHTHTNDTPTDSYTGDLAAVLVWIVSRVQRVERVRTPDQVCHDLAWSRCAQQIRFLWEGVAR